MKHRVEYPDGDHEWLKVDIEKHRIQVSILFEKKKLII
jgi:hypothetical protein